MVAPPAPLLRVEDLTVAFDSERGPSVTVLHGISFEVAAGQTLGIVGESGCGKSTLALAIMRLIRPPLGRIQRGHVLLEGEDLTALPEAQMRHRRGSDIGMIFQEPMTSLNPVYTVGEQIAEVLRRHRAMPRQEARARAAELLRLLQLPDPEAKLSAYPYQLSGGMRQRVMIAIALACEPKILLADEPTTALDVTVQAQIFDLLRETRPAETAMILITHDFGAVAEMADRVAVMYAGHKIEEGDVAGVIAEPAHPYTRGLLACMPDIHAGKGPRRGQLPEIPGAVPSLAAPPPGCPFAPRCPQAHDRCRQMPPLTRRDDGRQVACWLWETT